MSKSFDREVTSESMRAQHKVRKVKRPKTDRRKVAQRSGGP